jgi:hypothetical protein
MAALKYADRVKETTATTGTGTLTLAGAVAGYRTFASALSNADLVTYCIEDGVTWEVGQGTFTTAGTTLSRTLIASSSGSLLSLSGAASVFLTHAARDVASSYGGMYAYENASAITIEEANVYHALGVSGILTGLCNGFTFTAGVTGAIASVADYSGTVAGTIKITVTAGHNLTTGDIVTIHGTTNYNGTYSITTVSATEFRVTKAYVSTQTGSYTRGTRLVAGASVVGVYQITMGMTAWSANTGKTFKFEVNLNLTEPDNIVVSRAFATTDYSPMAACGLLELVPGDVLWIALVNQTSGTNITVRHLNLTVARV